MEQSAKRRHENLEATGITQAELDRIYGKLKAAEKPPRQCVQCGRPTYSFSVSDELGVCMDCLGIFPWPKKIKKRI